MFSWFRNLRRKRLLKTPFPPSWRVVLVDHVKYYHWLDDDEQRELEQLVQIFIGEKNFEGCGGLEITDEIRVVIATLACLLVLGLPREQYIKLDSILVYPTTVALPAQRPSVFATSPEIVPANQAVLGLASQFGPVLVVWDEVLRNTRHPERGHNVVFHEFAHILDLRDTAADGTPILGDTKLFHRWIRTCSLEYDRLRERARKGKKTLLDPYGAVHVAEFFSVATELFFTRPMAMQKHHPDLYDVLRAYYRQDTAARQKHAAENLGTGQ